MMGKVIRVRANPPHGYDTRSRADRFFAKGEVVELEVLDHEPPWKTQGPKGEEVFHPETSVETEVKNSTTGLPQKVRRPHPTKVGQAEYRAILEDPCLSVLEGGDVDTEFSQAALDAARKHSAELASDLTDAKAKLAAAEEQVAKLKAELAALRGKGGEGAGDPLDLKSGKPADDLHPHLRKDEVEDTTLPDSPSAKTRKGK
jgi:hypothetical protein